MQVLRRLEQELLAFKLETETKLTEEGRKLSGVIVHLHVESGGAASGAAGWELEAARSL